MKKIFILLALLISFSACTPFTRTEYEYNIVYTIGDNQYTESNTFTIDDSCTPAFIYGKDKIYGYNVIVVDAVPTDIWHERKTIYKGSLDCKITDFSYHKVRTYKASRWDGKEIKK